MHPFITRSAGSSCFRTLASKSKPSSAARYSQLSTPTSLSLSNAATGSAFSGSTAFSLLAQVSPLQSVAAAKPWKPLYTTAMIKSTAVTQSHDRKGNGRFESSVAASAVAEDSGEDDEHNFGRVSEAVNGSRFNRNHNHNGDAMWRTVPRRTPPSTTTRAPSHKVTNGVNGSAKRANGRRKASANGHLAQPSDYFRHLPNGTRPVPTSIPTSEINGHGKGSRQPSPEATHRRAFDAWGAGSDVVHENMFTPDDGQMLTKEAVKIPTSSDARTSASTSSHDRNNINVNTSINGRNQETNSAETKILDSYDRLLQEKSSFHFGYPYNLMYDHSELYEFMKYSINNLGDPYITSNYAVHSRQFECAVIDFFAELWEADKLSCDSSKPQTLDDSDDDSELPYWGYVTTSGTEGNLHGILMGRERFRPNAILYMSSETHYSVFKAANYYRMDCRVIPTTANGEIDYDLLEQELQKNHDVEAILNVNIGTTVKGAVDNLDRIVDMLKRNEIPRERYHIHCDGALFGLFVPFLKNNAFKHEHDDGGAYENLSKLSFAEQPIDSIAVSGHKMLGCPMPCGIALCRKEHVVAQHIDYLNSVDTTIMGSRNGQAALFLWYSLRKKGMDGIANDVQHCIETSRYLFEQLQSVGIECRYNPYSCTVVMERPMSQQFIQRWQLACEDNIAHVVVMPNITKSKIDIFVAEFLQCIRTNGQWKNIAESSPLDVLQKSSLEW
eukprot:CAMPEP_0119548558 /NCGR_PEP_ID=MMETSP1352-20130426/2453_1 /TAXON_ID=265584 /ORGANISM="Stauroneis constricta, Strain CCMP1120" /LENGTH=725 /DNA_ID=CAMNT_0007593867 /DNA_START=47 /DNA_END=2224 /DNA_ORIENTATION=+